MFANQSRATLTDLYQLTMIQSYWERGTTDSAVFEFSVRRLPPQRSFLLFAGLQQALEQLQQLSFDVRGLEWLQNTGRFSRDFIDWLAAFRFTGEVHAMAEGTPLFAGEPALRVTAPLPEAQLVESQLVNLLQFQTLVATKALRCCLAAGGRELFDFGMRRAHSLEAALLAARACYLAGFAGTSLVAAGEAWNMPVVGTMAHSYIQALRDELTAFRAYAASQSDHVVLLVDTYDVETGIDYAISVGRELALRHKQLKGIRIDSGDLVALSKMARQKLTGAGLGDTRILLSGGLDEYTIARIVAEGAEADGFGVGTSVVTSADVPYLECVYKLQAYAGKPTCKRSSGKETMPGVRQVYRQWDGQGYLERDIVTCADELAAGEPLLELVMVSGQILEGQPDLETVRSRVATVKETLGPALTSLTEAGQAAYPVEQSERLRGLAAEVIQGVSRVAPAAREWF